MFSFSRRHARPIALEVGHESVKMLQLSSPGRPCAIVAAARRPTPSKAFTAGGGLSQLLRQMLAESPFSGRRAVAALPSELVHTRTLRLPLEPLDLVEATRADWSNLFPFDINAAAVRFLHAGLVRQGGEVRREVIAFAARRDQVRAFHAELQAAGLTIQSLQVNAIAAHHAFSRLESQDEVGALLDLGAAHSRLTFGAGSTLTFVKSIDIGGRDFEKAVAHKLSLDESEARHLLRRLAHSPRPAGPRGDPVASAVFDATRGLAENLAHQVAMCFRYHAITFRGRRPKSLALVGGQASDVNIQRALAAALGVPINSIDPLDGIDTTSMRPADREPPAGRWAVCVGLGFLDARAAVTSQATGQALRVAA